MVHGFSPPLPLRGFVWGVGLSSLFFDQILSLRLPVSPSSEPDTFSAGIFFSSVEEIDFFYSSIEPLSPPSHAGNPLPGNGTDDEVTARFF